MSNKQNIIAKVYDKQNRLLGTGRNSYSKTHPMQALYAEQAGMPEKLYLHAEVEAIIKAMKNGIPYSIHVERYTKNGKSALAQPCPICILAIKRAGIKNITFTV